MNKQRLCYVLRKHYPEAFGIRKMLQKQKVSRLYNHVLSAEEIKAVEADTSKAGAVIAPYLEKWENYLKSAVREMEDIFKRAPLYKERTDKDILRDDMLFCRLAYGFIPSEYVGFELEHRTPEERKKFVSDIDMNYFGYSVNNIKDLQSILDKGDSFERFRNYFHRDGIVISKESDLPTFLEFVGKHSEFVKKAVFSSMGKGVELVHLEECGCSKEEYFHKLISEGKYLLEEKVMQHPDMAKFNNSSVNTIRCMTLKTKQGVIVPFTFMRTGRAGSFVDNGGSGGLLVGVDPETGVLDSDGHDEFGNVYETHPDSGIAFRGCQIPEWDALIGFCKQAAAKEAKVGYLSWDLAYTDHGWDVIEINEVGQFIGPQMIRKAGIKEELWGYLEQMEKVI